MNYIFLLFLFIVMWNDDVKCIGTWTRLLIVALVYFWLSSKNQVWVRMRIPSLLLSHFYHYWRKQRKLFLNTYVEQLLSGSGWVRIVHILAMFCRWYVYEIIVSSMCATVGNSRVEGVRGCEIWKYLARGILLFITVVFRWIFHWLMLPWLKIFCCCYCHH